MPTTDKIIRLDQLSHFKAKLDLILAGKADSASIPTVNNATLTIQKNGTDVTVFYANDNTNRTANITVPTTVAELSDASNYVLASALANIAFSGDYDDLTGAPTNVSDFTNDSGYQTASQVQTAINSAIAGITGIDFQVVQTLPATGEAGVIYLVPNSGTAPNVYDEYIWVTNSGTSSFEKIGTTAVDLSGYVQFTDILYATDAEIDALFT